MTLQLLVCRCLPARGLAPLSGLGLVVEPHGQPDPPARQIDVHDLDLDDLTGADGRPRIAHELAGERRDMHQAVLMDTDVHESAEIGHVGDRPLEDHAGLKILELLDVGPEGCGPELGARIPAGLGELLEDIPHRGLAKALVGVRARV